MDAQNIHQTQILEAQKSINAQQLNGPMIIGSTQQQTSNKGPVMTTTVAAPLGFDPVVNTDMSKITLGKNSVADKFESDIDVPPEDLYDDEFLNDLDHDRFVKIDDLVEMMISKEENKIFFRKMNPDTGKLDGEYVMQLGPGELEKVVIEILQVKEGLKSDVSLNSSNGVGLRIMKNCKEQFVVSILSATSVVVNMLSTTSSLLRKIIYIILFALEPPKKR